MDVVTLVKSLGELPLHAILLIAIVVLWRENQSLHAKVDQLKLGQDVAQAVLIDQNSELSAIKTQTAQKQQTLTK